MRRALVLMLIAAAPAAAQDSSFSHLRLRAAAVRFPEIGRLGEDWRAGTGGRVEIGTNVGRGELSLGVARTGFEARTGKPPFTETIFSLAWTTPLAAGPRSTLDFGARFSDVRMDFDDPVIDPGLRTEEEVLISAVGVGRFAVGDGFSVFAEGSAGVFMLSTKTPVVGVAVGIEHGVPMPGWLRRFLR